MIKQIYCEKIGDVINPPRYLSIEEEKLSESELYEKGIYKYMTPPFNPLTENLGKYIVDEDNAIISREVINTPNNFPEKEKINLDLLDFIEQTIIYRKWDWMIAREIKHGIPMPQEEKDAEIQFKNYCDTLRIEISELDNISINSYNVIQKILEYDGSFEKYIRFLYSKI